MLNLSRLILFSALLVATLPVSTRPARAEAPSDGPALIVLDGSGSMWGQIGNEKAAKFDLARGALRQSLAALSPRVQLGLLSFGQRRRADCSDVEVLASPESGGAERILSIADRLSPKGKGPLSLALKEAAKQIPAGEAGSIIAIHDGPDNCWQDPCAAAAEIAKTNPKTRIFLVGFGLSKAEAQGLACVARSTQGRVLEAHDSTRLAMAISEALTLANLERVDPTTGVAAPDAQAKAPETPGAPGVRLTAALAASGEPLKAAVSWRLAKAETPDEIVATARAPELAADVAPGAYVVEARFGQATARQPIEVKAEGATVAKISLGAGLLKINAQADRSGTALADPLVTIFAKAEGGDGAARSPVWIGRSAALDMVLPAGAYEVRVQDGLAAQTTEVTLAEGAGVDVAPVLGTGRLSLGAVAAASGEALRAVRYTIEEDDPDSPQGRREIARTADPEATFTLPAGTYYVSARHGVAETHDRIALGSGDTIQHIARFDLVAISVMTTLNTSEAVADARRPFLLRILSDSATPREIARASGATGSFQLPPGRYRVEAAVSGLNIKTQGLIDLTSGRGGNVELKLEAGEVSVAAGPPAGQHWRIKDGEGQTVLHSGRGGSVSAALLAPGRYVLVSDGEDRQKEQAFEIKAGERQTLSAGGP